MSFYFRNLVREILKNSVSKEYRTAKREWKLDSLYKEEGGECACTHDIVDHCVIVNIRNGKRLVVGNCCINQFLGIDKTRIFRNLNEIATKNAKPNKDTIEYAFEKRVITQWEYKFLLDVKLKRTFSEKQEWRLTQCRAAILKRFYPSIYNDWWEPYFLLNEKLCDTRMLN